MTGGGRRYAGMNSVSSAVAYAALQHFEGTIAQLPPIGLRLLRRVDLPILPLVVTARAAAGPSTPLARMSAEKPREFFIQGITLGGKAFRPSDWAERLAGALSSFRPGGGQGGIGAHIGYSPYCVPRVIENVKCVIVNEALRGLEPMAWDFVMNFARDNELQVVEACLLPDPPQPG